MQHNQLPTKSYVELEDNSITLICSFPKINYLQVAIDMEWQIDRVILQSNPGIRIKEKERLMGKFVSGLSSF